MQWLGASMANTLARRTFNLHTYYFSSPIFIAMSKLPQILGFVATCVAMSCISYFYGNVAFIRVFGAFFVIGGIAMIFAPTIIMGAKGFEGAEVSGWPKIFSIVPMLFIGCGMLIFAPELNCIETRQKNSQECKAYQSNKVAATPTSPSKQTPQ